ncbi:MAG: hypothetical protein JWP34_5011 [Massilia sp.]|nr:hypothetical protein [Massilia sp.]
MHFEIEDLFGEADGVAARWRFQATHGGPFLGTAATNKPVEQTANVIYQFRDGKISRAWVQVDRLGLLQQMARCRRKPFDRFFLAAQMLSLVRQAGHGRQQGIAQAAIEPQVNAGCI